MSNFYKSASGVTFLSEEVPTQEQMCNQLVDEGVDVLQASDWNDAVTANTADAILTALPESIHSYEGLEVKGQGIHSSCFAAALVGVAERQQFQKTKKVVRYAMWPCYMLGQMQTPGLYGTDGGTVPVHGIKMANKHGFLDEDIARKYLDPAIVRKWHGDVYPRGYKYGNHNFEQVANAAYREACRAYTPLLKMDVVREAMYANRLQTIIANNTANDALRSERTQTATTIECHLWTPDCDSHPERIETWSGQSRGGQHGHHATYLGGMSRLTEGIKANSWRPFELLQKARELGTPELSMREWGDNGLKTWSNSAMDKCYRHPLTSSFACSNMSVTAKPTCRVADTSDRTSFT